MKTDLYTKIVLTVIAGALIAIFFKLSDTNLVTTAQAAAIPAPAPQATHSPLEVNIVQVGGTDVPKYNGPSAKNNDFVLPVIVY